MCLSLHRACVMTHKCGREVMYNMVSCSPYDARIIDSVSTLKAFMPPGVTVVTVAKR